MIGTALLDRTPYSNYRVWVYNIGLGVIQSPGTLRSVGIPHLWAHGKSFQIMTTGWDSQA